MEEVEKEECRALRKVTLRLAQDHYKKLDDLAHTARLPLAVYCRELLLNRTPEAAPPVPDALPENAKRLLQICQNSCSNLGQIEAFAAAAGDPLSRIAGQGQLLQKLAIQYRELALSVKSGQLTDRTKIDLFLMLLSSPARGLNDELARPLNIGSRVSFETWKAVLNGLKHGLEKCKLEGQNHG